jgi:glycosyltransferase involved in cell wall biosynthesis
MLSQHRHANPRESREAGGDGVRVAYLSTYPPRECGLATFCEDLIAATMVDGAVGEPMVVAMENGPTPRTYRWPAVLIVEESREAQYEAAADFLNDAPIDVVSVQHEFGIFGGPQAGGLHRFLDRLSKPAVITLHTVTAEPEPDVRSAVRDLAVHSERLVVMNALAVQILRRDYALSPGKIALIHHGGVPPSPQSRDDAKTRVGLAGRRVLSTFGLVGRGKGLEYVLAALPEIRRRHPDVCYLIVGRTHPGVERVEKEEYREDLLRLVAELELHESVSFVNRYVSKSEIIRYLAATDVYITPYLNPQQITSGTLAYAVTAGRAIVSTPYAYARFLLREAGGMLVDFRSGPAIAARVNEILDRPDLQRALESRSRSYGRRMLWPVVGADYLSLFREAIRAHGARLAARTYAELQLSLPLTPGREGYHATRRDRPATVARPLAAPD